MKTTQPLLFAAVITLLITGCASQSVWYQEGKVGADPERDWRECNFEATKQASGAASLNEQAILQESLLKECMEAKGYKLVPKNEVQQMGGTVQKFE